MLLLRKSLHWFIALPSANVYVDHLDKIDETGKEGLLLRLTEGHGGLDEEEDDGEGDEVAAPVHGESVVVAREAAWILRVLHCW